MIRLLLSFLAVVIALLVGPGAAAAGDTASSAQRDEALEALDSDDASVRRRGVAALAVVGTMEDVPRLLAALRDESANVRGTAERAVWAVWSRSGDEEVDRLFAQGVEEMQAGQLAQSEATFTRIVERAPDFAEGWNKRATVRYMAGNLRGSLRDCDEVVRRNPVHFGVLSGYGLIHSQLGDLETAVGYFERALAINPNMPGIRANIEMLRRELSRRGRRESLTVPNASPYA